MLFQPQQTQQAPTTVSPSAKPATVAPTLSSDTEEEE